MRKTIVVYLVFFLLQIISGIACLYIFYLHQATAALETAAQRIVEDIHFNNGAWDMAEYNSDPEVPGRYRLYVFAKDGFVIDRWRPIPGYLDVSDFKHLLSYTTPATIHTVTNQDWRLYSLPLTTENNNTIGVITVSFFDSGKMDPATIDLKLKQVAELIKTKLQITNETIKVSSLDTRFVPFNISFQVVNRYNQILIKSNSASSMDRIPNFIDPSYVTREIDQAVTRQVTDPVTKETYLIVPKVFYDDQKNPVGLIVVGRTIQDIYDLLRIFLIVQGATGILLSIIGSLWLKERYVTKNHSQSNIDPLSLLPTEKITSIHFSKAKSTVTINDQPLHFTYASNQYVFCATLFSAPKKKWENDELLEKLGEAHSTDGWRKMYDAMTSINKKAHTLIQPKLIITNNKTFQINPDLVGKIKL
jgi:hypothetical protein